MEKLIRCFLLLAVMNFVSAEDTFFGENGTLLLKPHFSETITGIQWKHNNDMVAEWMEGKVDLEYYSGFKDRTTLNITTGSLEIENTRPADSGVYSLEINNKVQPERFNAKLIKEVPKPAVSMICAATSESCTLSCNGNTEKAGPVTYSWKMGGEWMDGEKDKIITNNETISVKTFSCRMKNPISEEESDPKPNPFIEEPASNNGTVVGLAVGLPVGVVVGVGLGVWKRKCIKDWFLSLINCKWNSGRDETI